MSLSRDFGAERSALRHAVDRCHNPEHIYFYNYGGRGIQVCDEWRHPLIGFTAFFIHIGPRPSRAHTLDRIDNDKGYEPGNVRWATMEQQVQNRRKREGRACRDFGWGVGQSKRRGSGSGTRTHPSPLIELQGRIQTLSDWAHELEMKPATIRQRLMKGLPPEQALSPILLSPSGKPRRDQ